MNNFYCLDLGITKCYLLECREGYLLIDTSYSKDYKRFEKELNKINVEKSRIKYLLLTHHHDDHAGFAAELVKQTGCKIIVHEKAIASLKNGISEDNIKPVNKRIKAVFSIFELFHNSFEYPPVNITKSDIIITGDNFDFLKQIGIDGKILYTPGHTKDSISVVLNNGNSFVGDVAMNFLQFCGIKYRPIYIENITEVYESWRWLKKEGGKKIYPAHGKPFTIDRLEPIKY
jgi:glyoxylase-like metal-dependent hydrolase (beta-lactamase superfamily II)